MEEETDTIVTNITIRIQLISNSRIHRIEETAKMTTHSHEPTVPIAGNGWKMPTRTIVAKTTEVETITSKDRAQ